MGRAILGADELAEWQRTLVYSDAVAVAEVARHGRGLLAPTALFELTFRRGDVLSFQARLSEVLLHAVGLLAAANRVFVATGDPKWLPQQTRHFAHVPGRFWERIETGMLRPAPTSVKDVDDLLAEVLDIVDERVPGADTATARFLLHLQPVPARPNGESEASISRRNWCSIQATACWGSMRGELSVALRSRVIRR